MTKRKSRTAAKSRKTEPAEPAAEPESAGMAPPEPAAEPPAATVSLDPADFDGILAQALAELAINVPYYDARLVGNRLEIHAYGGQLHIWPAKEE